MKLFSYIGSFFQVDATISGIQKAMKENQKEIASLKPNGALGKAIKLITVEAHRHLVSIIHVDTGAYKASQRMELRERRGDPEGRIFTDPRTRNPRSGIRPSLYGIFEEARGGEHASYERTENWIAESGLLTRGVNLIREDLSR